MASFRVKNEDFLFSQLTPLDAAKHFDFARLTLDETDKNVKRSAGNGTKKPSFKKNCKKNCKTTALMTDEEMKAYKKSVIRDLLNGFVLEETLDKYRHLASTKYRADPSDFSYDCSSLAKKHSQHIENIVGGDMNINDSDVTKKILEKLKTKHQTALREESEARMKTECSRLRRMLKEGNIQVEQLHRDPCIRWEYCREAKPEK